MKKKIEFSTGSLIIEDNYISFHKKNVRFNNSDTISRENIGHVDKKYMRVLPNSEFVHCFQLAFIGLIITILGLFLYAYSKNLFLFYGGLSMIIFSGALLFVFLYLDKILGLRIATPILYSLFGVDAYRIIVQNIYGGDNLQFLIKKEELTLLPDFLELKKYKAESQTNQNETNTKNNIYDDIIKLGDLRDNGLISNEEFELKKKQILGI
jgi:hypothetical protein